MFNCSNLIPLQYYYYYIIKCHSIDMHIYVVFKVLIEELILIQKNNFKPVEADDTSELSASEQLADLSE